VRYLTEMRAGEEVIVEVPQPPTPPEEGPSRPTAATRAYADVLAWEREHPDDFEGAVARYQDFLRSWAGKPEASRAQARIRELVDRAGRTALERLEGEIRKRLKEHRFTSALRKIRAFERRFGATESGAEAGRLRRQVREQARLELDALLTEVGPLVSANPREAHRRLLAAGPEFPPDLASEITELMERALGLMRLQAHPAASPGNPGRTVPEGPGRPSPPGPGAPPPQPGEPAEGVVAEVAALEQWKSARADLLAGRYADAFQGYTLVIMRYGNTDTYRQHKHAISAGRQAARVGAQGPAALLSVPVTVRRGRLEVEYTFDDARVVQRDFSIEQPFPSDREVDAKVGGGAVRLAGASGLFHVLVWEPDVVVQARIQTEVARDFGILAVEHSDDFRAIMFDIANTRFSLGKGGAEQVHPGHILWFLGQGAWGAADADAIGYIRIAERLKVKLKNGDRVNVEFIRKGDKCEASFQGQTDGVSLKGVVKGDDGKGMGPARIGVFANTGVIRVESLRNQGRVNEAWFEARLRGLIEEDPGPPENPAGADK
ncbi:MAG: hypothetical protein ACC662_11015, partial [Planctomycetota bacterium]